MTLPYAIGRTNIKRMLTYAFIDSIASQLYLQIFIGGFRIGLSVITLPIFLYYYRKVNPIILSFFIASIGLITRSALYGIATSNFMNALRLEAPTIVFDLLYGLLFYAFYYISDDQSRLHWFFVILSIDFVANTFEILFRYGDLTPEVLNAMSTLFFVACIRACISIIIVSILSYYKLFLKKEEHDERYRNLLILTSDLKSETYFMIKNMDYIEYVMNNAYELYETSNDSKYDDNIQQLSLTIAKDVHEIKKDYIRVIKGIEKITNTKAEYSVMKFKDLMSILHRNTEKYIESENLDIHLKIKIENDFLLKEHYLLMSILRNLVNNSIEALGKKRRGQIEIVEKSTDDLIRFEISDNGNGIKEKHLACVFDPGFSTKFNEATGDISRGLGLTLVKDIIETRFNGSIEVLSIIGVGTEFNIELPKKNLEVVENEILHN